MSVNGKLFNEEPNYSSIGRLILSWMCPHFFFGFKCREPARTTSLYILLTILVSLPPSPVSRECFCRKVCIAMFRIMVSAIPEIRVSHPGSGLCDFGALVAVAPVTGVQPPLSEHYHLRARDLDIDPVGRAVSAQEQTRPILLRPPSAGG